MANTAALISYPCFKDLEKLNTNFVESVAQQKKSRKSRFDKKESSVLRENCDVNRNNFTCNRENPSTNASRVRKKDIAILPTLLENEEKEENHKTFSGSGKITDLSSNLEEENVIEDTDAIFASYEGEALRPKIGFSNHSLVTLKEMQSSASLHSTVQEYNLRSTQSLAQRRSEISIYETRLSKNTAKDCKSRVLNCEPHMKLMANTNESKERPFVKCSQEPMKSSQEVLESTNKKRNDEEANAKAPSARNWTIVLGVTWVISLIAAIIFVAVNNVADESSSIQSVEVVTLTPTNYEICLLIGKNVRRLVVSSLVNLLYQSEL